MYVITTTFIGDAAAIDAARAAHHEWLDELLTDGVLLLAGRRDPRVGGVIVTRDVSRAELDRRLAAEPFGARGLAEHAVVRFLPTRVADGLGALLA